MNISSIILAWWKGTRLWPLSRKYMPKQFVKIEELWELSLYQRTLKRALKVSKAEEIYVVLTEETKHHWVMQAEEIGIKLKEENIIIQPAIKDTLPIISLAMSRIKDGNFGLIFASDHIMWDEEKLAQIIKDTAKISSDKLVALWIKPTYPSTWFGYLKQETPWIFSRVTDFKEKPKEDIAKELVSEGYLWNALILLLKKEVYFEELQKHNPKAFEIITSENVKEEYQNIEEESIDAWILMRTEKLFGQEIDLYWGDFGSFDSIWDYLEEKGYKDDKTLALKSSWNLVLKENPNKKICLAWVEDLNIIDRDDVLLIMKKWYGQEIKQIVKEVENGEDAHKNKVNYSSTIYRGWGFYKDIAEWKGYRTRRVVVLPGKSMKAQKHMNRSENWTIVSWTWEYEIGERKWILKKWESTFVNMWERHTVSNPWKVNLEIIESWIWEYLWDDDTIWTDQ